MPKMGIGSWLLVSLILTAGSLPAASIRYDVMPISATTGPGESAYRFTYHTTGLQLAAYQELDLRFDAATFVSLFNPVVSLGVDVLLLQPNNPPGAPGDLSLLALSDFPNLATFTLDVIVSSPPPPTQTYFLNEYDPVTMQFIGTISSGSASNSNVPEPSSFVVVATGMFCFGALLVRMRG